MASGGSAVTVRNARKACSSGFLNRRSEVRVFPGSPSKLSYRPTLLLSGCPDTAGLGSQHEPPPASLPLPFPSTWAFGLPAPVRVVGSVLAFPLF